MSSYSYHKVSEHRGRHRVWVENSLLTRSGFSAGAAYERVTDLENKVIYLKLVESNEIKSRVYTVATGQNGVAIIDLCNKTISEVYGDHERVRVEYKNGVIVISLHHICKLSDERVKRFRNNLASRSLSEGTFCAGIGMATLAIHEGFSKHGVNVKTDWILDRDSRFLDIAMSNNEAVTKDTRIISGSMEEIEIEILTPVDIFQISMSCKVHSKASRSKLKRDVAEDHKDAAGLFGLFKAIEKINPAVIISENVLEAMSSASYLMFKAVLNELHYNYYELVLDAAQSGSFENRKRYWLLAVDKNLPIIDINLIPTYSKKYECFSEFMEIFASNNSVWRKPTELQLAKVERDTAKGNGFSNTPQLHPNSTKSQTLRAEYAKAGSTDVRVSNADGGYRMLTPIEHCLMKSAPLKLIDNVGQTLAHYVLGQGVDYLQALGISELVCLALCKAQIPNNVFSIKTDTQDVKEFKSEFQIALF